LQYQLILIQGSPNKCLLGFDLVILSGIVFWTFALFIGGWLRVDLVGLIVLWSPYP
jgi:hypothetical protein